MFLKEWQKILINSTGYPSQGNGRIKNWKKGSRESTQNDLTVTAQIRARLSHVNIGVIFLWNGTQWFLYPTDSLRFWRSDWLILDDGCEGNFALQHALSKSSYITILTWICLMFSQKSSSAFSSLDKPTISLYKSGLQLTISLNTARNSVLQSIKT